MGDQVYKLVPGESIPVEPVGVLASDGWLPGTWVAWDATEPSFSGAMGTVDRSDGTGILAGFLVTGPQHNTPVEELSDMWTTDSRQRDGGDTKADWSSIDASARFAFDADTQLQRMGSRIVTMAIPPTGYWKFHVFETENLAERTTPGSGALLTYAPGAKLYVSDRGRLTSEMESGSHVWTGYVVGRFRTHEFEDDYILAVAAIG